MMNILETLSNFLYYVIPFIIVICVLVFVHELGHYLVAKYFGVKIEAFSIGMGKELYGKTDKSGTRWKISAFPIGGYVMMLGDKDPSSAPNMEDIEKMSDDDKSMTLQGKKPWQRILISFAGPFANIIYAFVAVFFVYAFFGKAHNNNYIDIVQPDTPAYIAGILPGDKVVLVNDNIVNNAADIVKEIQKSDVGVRLNIQRNDENINLDLNFQNNKMLGVTFQRVYKKVDFIDSFAKSFYDTCFYINAVFSGLVRFFTGKADMKQFGGPIAIAGIFGDISKTGDIAYFIFFSALLSINLALFNLILLPPLDGGNIFIDFIEMLRNKPLSLRIREAWNSLGIWLFMCLVIFATFNDILKLSFVRNLLSVFGY